MIVVFQTAVGNAVGIVAVEMLDMMPLSAS